MITEHDLQEAIAECHGERNPNANTCIKLAAFYTLKREMFGKPEPLPEYSGYSYAAAPETVDTARIIYTSDTEFSRTIDGKRPEDVWPVMDELMSTIQVLIPKLYTQVMNRLQA